MKWGEFWSMGVEASTRDFAHGSDYKARTTRRSGRHIPRAGGRTRPSLRGEGEKAKEEMTSDFRRSKG
jgi:hypothetical protein